jgi:hypothetical protein
VIGLVLQNKTVRLLGHELGISHEGARQLLSWLNAPMLKQIQTGLGTALVIEDQAAIRLRYRDGVRVGKLVKSELLREFSSSETVLADAIRTKALTTQDHTVHQVRSGKSGKGTTETWTDIELYNSLRRVSQTYCDGAAPSVAKYESIRQAEAGSNGPPYTLPSVPLIVSRCGSWTAAQQRAGFDVIVRGHRCDRVWTTEECISRLLDLVRELDQLPTVAEYDEIQQSRPQDSNEPDSLPSSATVRNRLREIGLGQWEAARAFLVQRLLDSGEWS